MAPVVVDHHVQVRISAERARLPYLHEEVADLDLVGGAAQHVDEVLEEGADGAVDSDAAHSTFVDHQLDRLRHRAPSVGLPHPRVEARFVEVDYRGLLMNQLCKLNSELLPLVDELLVKGGVICGGGRVEADLVLAVELEQRLRSHLDVVLLPDPLRPVLECEAAPSLQRVTSNQLLLQGQQLLSRIWARVVCAARLEAQPTPNVVAECLVASHDRDVQQPRYLLVR